MIPQREGLETGLWQKEIDAGDLIDADAADARNCRSSHIRPGLPEAHGRALAQLLPAGLEVYG